VSIGLMTFEMQPKTFTIILNTNRREDTLACLASLHQGDYLNNCTIVLDNHSNDGSTAAIRAAFPNVQIIELSRNLGYTGNNNEGIRAALDQDAGWVFILNEDTILAPDCLTRLVEVGESDPQVGILGPTVYHFDEPNVIQSAGGTLGRLWLSNHRGQNEPDRGQFSDPQTVDWISGCAILVRRELIERVGMLDERFFYYWEETEWCVRARADGWKIVHVPQAKIWHKGVQRDYRPSPNVTYYATRNWLMLLIKHRAPWFVWIYAIWRTTRTLTSWTIRPKWRSMRVHRDAMWQGVVDFISQKYGMRSI